MPLFFVHFMPSRISHLRNPSAVTSSIDASAVRFPASLVASQYFRLVIFCRDLVNAESLDKRERAMATRASCWGSRNIARRVKSLCMATHVGQPGSHSVKGEGICPRERGFLRRTCSALFKVSSCRSILRTIRSICLSLAAALLLFRLVPPTIYTLLLIYGIYNAFGQAHDER